MTESIPPLEAFLADAEAWLERYVDKDVPFTHSDR
jgi:hypothetical protein